MSRRYIPLLTFLLLLFAWPLTYRYTSFGIDRDHIEGHSVYSRYYRVRWPGNGSMMVGFVDEHHRNRGQPVDAFDLGGRFLHPADPIEPQSAWNWLGFWRVNVDAARGDASSPAVPGADRAVLVGVPHWGLVVIAGLILVCRRPVPSPRRGEG